MSRPPALDPDAERWAARFETLPPPSPDNGPRKRSGRWKTQAMGSMVPLNVVSARHEPDPASEAPPSQVEAKTITRPVTTPPSASIEERDIPTGFRPQVDPSEPEVARVCDSLLQQGAAQGLALAVTGGRRGSDKGRFAAALALAFANAGVRVLLVEADFDNPQVHQALGLLVPMGMGFSQQLAARRQDRREQPWVVLHCSNNLQVLAEGRLRSPGLLPSTDFAGAVADFMAQYPVLVIHAPSLDQRAEVTALGPLVQAVVVTKPGSPPQIHFGPDPFGALL